MMSLPLCRASSKMSIMPSGATQRSDTKVLLSLKRNTPGRSPFERRHVCPSQRVHSILREADGEAIEEYVHGVGIDLGEDEREGIVSGRPHGGIEIGGNEALVGEARRTLALRSCVCIGRDPGGRKQNEKGFYHLTQARRGHGARLQRSGAQAV